MMKTKLILAVATIGLFAISCGESAETAQKNEAMLEETRELGNKLDKLNQEIEAIETASAEVDETMNELDNI